MLKGKRINLRLLREADLDRYIALSQDVSARGNHFPLEIRSESTIRQRFKDDGFWSDTFRVMAIADVRTDEIIGTVMIFTPTTYYDALELGYILHDVSRRGEGLMVEAVQMACDYLFRWKNIYRIQIQVEAANIASKKTAERAGFTYEGTIRQCLISNCAPLDLEMYSLLRGEFEVSDASSEP